MIWEKLPHDAAAWLGPARCAAGCWLLAAADSNFADFNGDKNLMDCELQALIINLSQSIIVTIGLFISYLAGHRLGKRSYQGSEKESEKLL